jgi:hypothetical protein
MSIKKRCLVSEDGNIPNQLVFVKGMSISIGTTAMMMYYCKGDKYHKPHFIRIDEGTTLYKTKADVLKVYTNKANRKGISIEEENRKRLFPHQKILKCVIGKCKIKYLKTLTDELGENGVEYYKCSGTMKGHLPHIVRIAQGQIPESELGLIIFTVEK